MFSCKTTGDQNEGTHPELLLMLKPASQWHKHDCIKHAPLITLSKVLGFFRKTESKCAICATLLLEMWWKRQWKGKKKKKLWMLLSLSFWASWALPASSCQQLKPPHGAVSSAEASPLLHREVAEMQDFSLWRLVSVFSKRRLPHSHKLWKIPGFCTPRAL